MRLLAILLLLPGVCLADEKPLDFWAESYRLLSSAKKGQHVDHDLIERRHVNYRSDEVSWDVSDKRVGDLSLVYSPRNPGAKPVFGFVSSLWGETWDLKNMEALNFWVKVRGGDAKSTWELRLVDKGGRTLTGNVTDISGEWSNKSIPLKELSGGEFNWRKVALLEFEQKLPKGVEVMFDGVHFSGKSKVLGITDKTLTQRMAEAETTRDTRVRAGFEDYVRDYSAGKYEKRRNCQGCAEMNAAFSLMMLDMNLEWANQALAQVMNAENGRDTWSLWKTPMYLRFYFQFSNKNGKYPGRMSQEVEDQLLQVIWNRTVDRNDIHWAKQDTWWMDGSENHDLNEESCNIASSRLFMLEDEYKDRVLPNAGFGGGALYGKAGYYGPGITWEERAGGGRANLADGKDYTAADNYEVWVEVFDHYVRERARHGFFLEHNSPGYAKHTLGFLELGYMYSGNENLKQLFSDFYNLYWADWAQLSQHGVLGGPKTRHRRNVGGPNSDSGTNDLINFHLGGPANGGQFWYWNQLNDFELHPVVWKLALDKEGMGEFAYLAKGVGEEQQIWPRPAGTERSLLIDPHSRFLKSAWLTPSFAIGTQMDHPAAIHSHLSTKNRWQGMTVAGSAEARIVPVSIYSGVNHQGKRFDEDVDVAAYFHSVHHKRTMIAQRARSFLAISPVWFPSPTHTRQVPIGIHVGRDWDERREESGWVFLRKGGVYAGVRPVMWDAEWERANQIPNEGNQINFHRPDDPPTAKICEGCYTWKDNDSVMALTDSDAPILIEAGSQKNFGSFESFIDDVLDNPLALYKTVVPGFHILVYTGSGEGAEEIVYNAAAPDIPTIGGEPVDYSYPKTFDTPFMQSEYGSGEVLIEYGEESLELKF